MIEHFEHLTMNTETSILMDRSCAKVKMMRLVKEVVLRGEGDVLKFRVTIFFEWDGYAAFGVVAGGTPLSVGTICWKPSVAPQAFDQAMSSMAQFNGSGGCRSAGRCPPASESPSLDGSHPD